MNGRRAALMAWRILRPLRWALWIGFVVYSVFIWKYRPDLITVLGHLPGIYDVAFYTLGNAAIFVGFFEMMMREKAGVPRPDIFRKQALKS